MQGTPDGGMLLTCAIDVHVVPGRIGVFAVRGSRGAELVHVLHAHCRTGTRLESQGTCPGAPIFCTACLSQPS